MKILRKIISASLISSVLFICIFLITLLIGFVMMDLKNLSQNTIQVLADWNTLDRISNDVLYYRLDSVHRMEQLEGEWIEAEQRLDHSFTQLINNRWLKVLPVTVNRNILEALYIWKFSQVRLLNAQSRLTELIHGEETASLIFDLDKTTFYGKMTWLIENGSSSWDEARPYRLFLSNMSVLDITSNSFSEILTEISEELPRIINKTLFYLLFIPVTGLIIIILVSLGTSWHIIQPLTSLARAVRQMGDGEYEVNLNEPQLLDEDNELGIINAGMNRLSKRIHSLYEESLQREKEKRSAQFRALQYQMNPHFLYNTLSSLQMSANLKGQKEIANNLKSLGRLLRNTINYGGRLVTLEEEAAIASDYIQIMQTRFKNRIIYHIEIPDVTARITVPALVLQPLLENAILHGLSQKINTREEALLSVRASLEGDRLRIGIQDNGCGIPGHKRSRLLLHSEDEEDGKPVRIGLKNIQDRIKLIYGEDYGLEIESTEGSHTLITLVLPAGGPDD